MARQLGKVCLVGCADLSIDDAARTVRIGGVTLHEGDVLTLDGNEGVFYAGSAEIETDYPADLMARLDLLRSRDGQTRRKVTDDSRR